MIEVDIQATTGCSAEHDVLVLDAKLRQSLVTLRSLGSRGMRAAAVECVNGGGEARRMPGFASRWCARAYKAPGYKAQAGPFLAYIQQILQYRGARVLITSSDSTLALVRNHRSELERWVSIALAKEEALAIACNKERTLQVAERLGLSVPKAMVVHTLQDVATAVHEVGLPAVIKPSETWGWDAEKQQGKRLMCVLVTTLAEAQSAVEQLNRYGGTILFQQYLTGRREAISFLYAKNTFYARFAQWARRTQPPLGGTSVFRQSIALPPDSTEQAERLVREIDLEGYSEVEFRRDTAGKPYIMEINPRLSASVEVAVRAGIDFPYLLYQWASGGKIEAVNTYQTGGWMRYLGGDILTLVQMIRQYGRPGVPSPSQAFYEFLADFFQPSGYDYFDWRDPMPALTAVQAFVERECSRIPERISSSRRVR